MGLTTGTRFGPYEIADAIGAGGMGEVYRARDTTLDRVVAIKVLPSTFSTDAARVMRFEQEAKTLAALNHANIAQIYGLERSGGTTALVMELVEGITLAERIAQEPLPVDEALAIAAQIAAALEAAHERRIVHRDLKPANIKLRADGTVKVLDFGIAKALDPREASGSQPAALTTPAMTEAGAMLGTAAYMSPEQARGKAIDQRADIWAFGCVLYEMLTGRSPFGDEDVMGTLAHVLDRDADFEVLPPSTPSALRQTLQLCLRKNPRERIADIRDVRLALKGAFETRAPAARTVSASHRVWPVAAALVIGAVLSGFAAWRSWPEPEARAVNRFVVPVPAEHRLRSGMLSVIDIAPDGRSFLYEGANAMYLRRLDELEARPIPGPFVESGGAFFAPGGDTVAYFQMTPLSLQRIPTAGGAPVIVTGLTPGSLSLAPRGRWERDGTILYSTGAAIYRVRGEGGEPQLLVEAGTGETLYGAQLLPGGEALLFAVATGARDTAQIVIQALDGDERKVLVSGGSDPRYVPTGHMLYAFQDDVFAVAFDADAQTVVGAPVAVVENVDRPTNRFQPATQFAVADDGTLVYLPAVDPPEAERTLVWVSRDGREESFGLPDAGYVYARVASDGAGIVMQIQENDAAPDIWVSDVARPVLSRITSTPQGETFPTWTPDGRRVVFATGGSARARTLSWTLADGTGAAEPLVELDAGLLSPGSWTPDGRHLLFTYGAGTAQPEIGMLSIEPGADGNRSWRPLIERAQGASAVNVAPNGEWIAYHTDDTGQYGVYIERYPQLGERRLVSDQRGGWGAIWSRSGEEIFYRRLGDGAMMAVSVETSPAVKIGTPQLLFASQGYLPPQTPDAGGASPRSWDLAPDGRFLMIKRNEESQTQERAIIVVENWFEELKQRVPTR